MSSLSIAKFALASEGGAQTRNKELRNAFQGARNLPKLSRPIPLVLSGGTATPKGFREHFETVLRASDFPIELSEIRTAADPLTTTAKGALVAALSETEGFS